jgi:hypothetical protein
MSGLATIAWVENVIGAVLAASPVEHELHPSFPGIRPGGRRS